MATYQRCVQVLRELDLEAAEETRALAFKRNSRLNIPIPLTSFIGRQKEVKEVVELLSKSRLVTLTGSGGVGKTRLAIEAVADGLELFPDGVWFLDLAPLNDASRVPGTLANLLGLRESEHKDLSVTDQLITYFRSRAALVLFDNCEHLIEAAAQLVNILLTSCENLSILATSREGLRVAGEIPYRVPSLEIPRTGIEFAVDELSNIESLRLFAERAAVASREFAFSSQNAAVIAQICRRLDGIPLAIELAAARTDVLSAQEISKRLDDRFNLLTRGLRAALPRHQTLRAMIEWSYSLLSEQERILFRRLAAFAGGWTLEAAEEVCSGNTIHSKDVLDLLSQLVDKSLVLVETKDGASRYRRLETIRQFAREKLAERGEANQLQDRHMEYFLNKAEEIEPFLTGSEQSVWMDYLELELDNIRAAMEWSISNKRGEESLRLIGSLSWFFFIHCHFREGSEWLERALKLRIGTSQNVQAKAIGGGSVLNYAMGDLATTSARRRESAELYRELGDLHGLSTELQFAGVVEFERGNRAQARPLLEESLHISLRIENKSAMPRVLKHLGHFAEMEGDYVAAWRYYEESLAICREIGEGHMTTIILATMGDFMLAQKDFLKAHEYYNESLEIGIKMKNKRMIAATFLSFAQLLCAEERHADSARLQGFAESLFNEAGSFTESHLAKIKQIAVMPKKHLGKETYQQEFEIGRGLKLEQAVEMTLKRQTCA
jgi:non-specific serine/threonine protein kinase